MFERKADDTTTRADCLRHWTWIRCCEVETLVPELQSTWSFGFDILICKNWASSRTSKKATQTIISGSTSSAFAVKHARK